MLRFSGTEFPPFIVFKIYTQMQDGRTAKYINGKNTITPSSSVLYNHFTNNKSSIITVKIFRQLKRLVVKWAIRNIIT